MHGLRDDRGKGKRVGKKKRVVSIRKTLFTIASIERDVENRAYTIEFNRFYVNRYLAVHRTIMRDHFLDRMRLPSGCSFSPRPERTVTTTTTSPSPSPSPSRLREIRFYSEKRFLLGNLQAKTFDRDAFMKTLLLLRVSHSAFVGGTRVGGI